MSEIEGGGSSEVSSAEVSEAPAAETGGEASEATQEAATESANESGGFNDSYDNSQPPESSMEDDEDEDYEEDPDDSQDVGFSEGEDVDNSDSQYDETDYDTGEAAGDENGVGFDDYDTDMDEDPESDEDVAPSDDTIEESDDSPYDTDDNDSSTESEWDDQENDDTSDDNIEGEDDSLDNQDDDFDDDDIDEDLEEDLGDPEDYSDETEEGENTESDTEDDNNLDGDEDNDGNPDDADHDSENNAEDDDNLDGDEDNDGNPDDADHDAENNAEDDDNLDGDEDNDGNPDDADHDPENDAEDDDNLDGDEDNDGNPDDADHNPENDAEDDDNLDGDEDNDGNPDDADHDAENNAEDDDNLDGDEDNDGNPDDADHDPENNAEDDDNLDGDEDNDGNPDDADHDAENNAEDDDNLDDDYDEDEDPGELESYSEDENNDSSENDDDSEQKQEEEERAAEEANQEAADRAESETQNSEAETAGDDAAESENRNSAETGTETQAPPEEGDNSHNEVDTEAPHTDNHNSPDTQDDVKTDVSDKDEDNSSDSRDQSEGKPEDAVDKADNSEKPDAYRTAMNNMAEYMYQHNYGPDDYAEYSKDPEWYKLNSELQKSLGMEVTPPTKEVAMSNMANYLNEHNYGPGDYPEYSQDPEWQKLNADLQQSLGMEVTTDVSTPSPESGKDVSATELPDNCVMVNASDIDMTYAQGMNSDHFWNHHGNTKEDYMRLAEKIPDVQQALDSGKSLDEIKQDPALKDTVHAYFDPENMIKVEQQADGSYSYADNGRHRIAAAQELGYQIPVEVSNMPENTNAAADNLETKPEDTAGKSDISSETRENLGAFEQNTWDNLTTAEKEQAVEKLRDSIAEDLQLENKPNIAYYYEENPRDFGGYAASTNTIYINRFNMGNAAETADTIVHESRHCWQHERADNPQTEQDYQFKENFDNYIRPEDDFYEYQNQPVEVDARDYAQTIKDAIPESGEKPEAETTSVDKNDSKNNDAPPSTTGPPESTYHKIELPADFENKISYQPLNEQAEKKCQLAGMEKGQVQKIREIPNGQKPNPEDYLSKDTIDSHLRKFEDEGCYKVIPGEPVGTVGKGDSLFVCRGSELEKALVEADGDPRKLENALGMDEGYLGDNPYVVRVDNPKDLRMATGNETNAWQDYWCPGGTTIGGMDEAVITPPSPDDYSFKPCFENDKSTSIYDENWKKH